MRHYIFATMLHPFRLVESDPSFLDVEKRKLKCTLLAPIIVVVVIYYYYIFLKNPIHGFFSVPQISLFSSTI